jgi:hypothetical protein
MISYNRYLVCVNVCVDDQRGEQIGEIYLYIYICLADEMGMRRWMRERGRITIGDDRAIAGAET